MRILQFSNYYQEHVGGIETVAATLAHGYRSRGHVVHWIAGDISARPHVGSADDVAIHVWNGVEKLGFPYPVPSPAARRRIRQEVAWADIVHMHDCLYALNVAGFLEAHAAGRPVLLTQHIANVPYPNPLLRGLQSAAYATFGHRLLRSAEQVVFVSAAVKRYFESRIQFGRPPVLIPNGVNCALFHHVAEDERAQARERLGLSAGQPLVLFVGQFKEKKGVSLLRPVIEATADWRWLMIGRPVDVHPADWALPNLQVVPPVESKDLRAFFGPADLVVLPGREAFPVVAQESMACGTPVLLSSQTVEALPELRRLVFSADAEPRALRKAIASAIESARSDAGLRQRVSTYARDHWCSDVMVARYEALLTELLVSAAKSAT